MNRAILDGGMVDAEANVRNGIDQVSLQTLDLISVGGKPGAPFQRNRKSRAVPANLVGTDSVWFVFSLTKVKLPRRFSVDGGQPFALHGKIPGVVRMEDEHEGGQTLGGDASGEIERRRATALEFFDAEKLRADFFDGNHVVILAVFLLGNFSGFVERFVEKRLGGSESLDIRDKLLNSCAGFLQEGVEIAGGARLDRRNVLVDLEGHPVRSWPRGSGEP